MRNGAFRCSDELLHEDLLGLEKILAELLTQEIRLSPNGVIVRIPLWLISHIHHQLPGHQKHRVSITRVHGVNFSSALSYLNINETVLLWLIETMAHRHPAFKIALQNKKLSVYGYDNTNNFKVEFQWDPSHLALHALI